MNFICGNKFADMSDFEYYVPNVTNYWNRPSTFDPSAVEAFDGVPVVFTETHHLPPLIPILEKISKKLVLITHNSDHEVTEELYSRRPPNVLRWFSVCATHKGDYLEPLPVGLENEEWSKVFRVFKHEEIRRKQTEEKTYKNLLYLNISIRTNPKERELPYNLLANKPFVTTVSNPNTFDFLTFIDNVYRHKFVLCPRGNGTDSHRTWETLYLDSIPVMKRTWENSFYQDLPICFVDSWEQVTEEFLNTEYDRIINAEWNLDKLEFDYWKKKIQSYTL